MNRVLRGGLVVFLLFLATFLPVAGQDPEAPTGQSIGRMIMVGFRGLQVRPDSPIVRQIRRGYVGGVVLYERDVPSSSPRRNVASPEQVRRLIGRLQSIRDEPLLVAVDQEGGQIQRLPLERGFEGMDAAARLGARSDTQQTYHQALRTAQQLAKLGFNVNFAPVVDLDRNPGNPVIGRRKRSYGSEPGRVVDHGASVIRAHREQGVIPVIKHFPGHGSSRGDSHRGFVDVTGLWDPRELIPFRRLIELHGAQAVMTAHVFNRHWDPRWPATLSPGVIRGMLREEIGFDGVVFSNDLQMGALRRNYDRATVLRRAIRTGVDVLLLANNSTYEPGVARRTVDTIRRLIEQDQIKPEQIRESNRRIHRLMRSYRLPRP